MKEDYKPKYIERKYRTIHALHIKPTRTCKSRYYRNTGKKEKIVCSTEESLTDELNYIRKTMRLNGYPEKLITKTIKRTLLSNSKSKNSENLETPKLFIPYEKGIAEQLKRVANRYGLEVIFTRSLSLKSKLPTNPFKSCSTCGVVYK